MPRRVRLDAELVRRGLLASMTDAAHAIDEHRILVNGAVAERASRLVGAGDALVLEGPPPRYVSRGGDKLEGALVAFGIDPVGLLALDAGASTGGFTDCLLQHGASHVVAIDVGHGQLHPKIRNDARVTVIERFNIRQVGIDQVGRPVDLVVADLSFISLAKVIPALASVAAPGAAMVLLVKPQFEAGRQEVSRGAGIITDPDIHERVRDEVAEALDSSGCNVVGWADSPITGTEGNREFLVLARAPLAGSIP